MAQRRRFGAGGLLVSACLACALIACGGKASGSSGEGTAPELPGGLTPELAAKVLARVDNRTITLGDFAAALERMNEFDRSRFQSPEKRRELLREMIDLELLAGEAERRGLDKAPETREAVRQALRDAYLADARKALPAATDIPEADARAYYDAHPDDYREPERRRVAVMAFVSRAEAEKVLPEAMNASALEWGKLVQARGDARLNKITAGQPIETVGELGIVGPPGDERGGNPRVPEPVRAAVFAVPGKVGAVLDRVVEAGSVFYVVRLAGKTAAHDRPFAEAARGIRAILLQQKMAEQERALGEKLKTQFPVSIDEAALARVNVPGEAASNHDVATPPASSRAPAPRP